MATGFLVENHPEKQKIIDMILAGKPVREISNAVTPSVNFMALQRYKANVLKPVLANAELSSSILIRPNKPLQALSSDTKALQMTKSAIMAAPILTIRDNRVAEKVKRHRLLEQIRAERAADMELCESCRRPKDAHPWEDPTTSGRCDVFHAIPGGTTGLIIRKLKATGIEYAIDTSYLGAADVLEKDIAIEQGQWNENAGGSGISIQIICPQAPEIESAPRISYSESDQLTLEGDVCADIATIQKK